MKRTNRKETVYGFSRHVFVVSNSLSPLALSFRPTNLLHHFAHVFPHGRISYHITYSMEPFHNWVSLSLALCCFMNGP